jgi:2-hydroxychromene-2-carboxylate isomerase
MTHKQPHIQFCFDYISPYSYLAAIQMPELSVRLGIPIIWQPVNLPRLLITLAGNTPPATIPNKARYLLRDLKQWSQHLGVPFHMIKPGAFDSRLAIASTQALSNDDRETMAQAIFNGLWAERIDYRQEDWLNVLLAKAGLPAEWILTDTYSQHMDKVNVHTEEVYKSGAFGVPTFFLRGAGRTQMFWGIDRLDFLEQAVNKALLKQ